MKKMPTHPPQAGLPRVDILPAGSGANGPSIIARKHRRERMFDSGDIRLLIMSFLEKGAAHGYELIKAIQDLSKGEYTPSASIVYPNLTFLEVQGYAAIGYDAAGKKQYNLTADGHSLLNVQRDALDKIIGRLASLAILSNNRSIPDMQRAINNIRMALNLRLAKGQMSRTALYKIIDTLDNAAKAIERS